MQLTRTPSSSSISEEPKLSREQSLNLPNESVSLENRIAIADPVTTSSSWNIWNLRAFVGQVRQISLNTFSGAWHATASTSLAYYKEAKSIVFNGADAARTLKNYYLLEQYVQFLEVEGESFEACFLELKAKPSKSPLEMHCFSFLSCLVRFKNESSEDYEGLYHEYVSSLRKAAEYVLKSENLGLDNKYKKFIEKACQIRYSQVYISDFLKRYLEKCLGESLSSTLNFTSLRQEAEQLRGKSDYIIHEMRLSKVAVFSSRVRGGLGMFFDPSNEENPPYIRGIISVRNQADKMWDITSFRQSTPTDQYILHTEVTSDYKLFVQSSSLKNLHFVLEQSGKARSQKRFELGEMYPDRYFIFGIPVDTEVYKGLGKTFHWTKDKSTLKAFLIEAIKKNSFGFHSPKAFLEKDPTDFLNTIFEEVKRKYFSYQIEEGFQTKEEYQAFILFFYAEWYINFCIENKIDLAKAVCKDGIDRANAFQCLVELILLYATGKENDSQSLQELLINLQVPPILAKSQGILADRLEFFYRIYDHLEAHPPERPLLFFSGVVTGISVPMSPIQLEIDRPSLSKDSAEYWGKFDAIFEKEVKITVSNPFSRGIKNGLLKEGVEPLLVSIKIPQEELAVGEEKLKEWLKSQYPEEGESIFEKIFVIANKEQKDLLHTPLTDMLQKKDQEGCGLYEIESEEEALNIEMVAEEQKVRVSTKVNVKEKSNPETFKTLELKAEWKIGENFLVFSYKKEGTLVPSPQGSPKFKREAADSTGSNYLVDMKEEELSLKF